jgi:hypothetical protein
MATPDEIRESELDDKVKSLGCFPRRSPSNDYGCFLVYETLHCSGSCAVSKTSTKLKTSLRRGNRLALDIPRVPRLPSYFDASEGMPLKGKALADYFKPAIQSHNGRRSSSSIANPRMSLSSVMACRRRTFASSMRPVTLA